MAKSTTKVAQEGLTTLVRLGDLKQFGVRCLVSAGALPEHAEIVSRVLASADVRGIPSHGFNRLDMYVSELQTGAVDGKAKPSTVKQKGACALVSGNNGSGPVVGEYAMDLAIKSAKEHGVGWVVANSSNHYGIAGHYAMMASSKGLFGMSFTNTSPLIVPTRAAQAALGTNPIAAAAPVRNGDDFVLDMATSSVPIGKVEVCQRAGRSVPRGWGVDMHGEESTSADEILDGGGLLPLGGLEETSGYKGYGLAMLVEILCGTMSGSKFGTDVAPWRKGRTEAADLGQCFIAVDPTIFNPTFDTEMETLCHQMKTLRQPLPEDSPVLIPGEPEDGATRDSIENGVRLHPHLVSALQNLSKELTVDPLPILGELSS